MHHDEYLKHDATALAQLVQRGDVSALELLETAIQRLETVNPQINAVAETLFDEARDAARRGLPRGPFSGVPFAVKDLNHAVQGVVLAHGSRAFAGQRSDHDSESVRRFRAAGLNIFCTSTSPEFGLSVTTESALRGATRNPWNLDHSSGGSSGGAAALVAAGVIPMAHATDGGGSIRVPASCCGLVGLKPGRGTTPVTDRYSEGWNGLTTSLCVSRTVRDSAAVLDSTHGIEAGSRYGVAHQPGRYLDALNRPPRSLRIAVMREAFNGAPVHADCLAALDVTVRLLAGLGHSVEEAAPKLDIPALTLGMTRVIASHVAATIEARGRERGAPVKTDELETVTAFLAQLGRAATAVELISADQAFMSAARSLAQFHERFDLLLTPTLAQPPAKLGEVSLALDPGRYVAAFASYCPFTALANQTGVPAISLPLHWNDKGLPVGSQFIAPLAGEATLLGLAAQLEQAHPWFDRVRNLRVIP